MALIDRAGPYGQGHSEPRFAFPAHTVAFSETVGQGGHIRLSLRGGDNRRLDGIAFRAGGTPLGETLLAARGRALHVAGRLKRDTWQGRSSIRLMVEDAAQPA